MSTETPTLEHQVRETESYKTPEQCSQVSTGPSRGHDHDNQGFIMFIDSACRLHHVTFKFMQLLIRQIFLKSIKKGTLLEETQERFSSFNQLLGTVWISN
jgi:hypothetical protein